VSTPLTPLPQESFAGYEEGTPPPAADPDNPHWGVGTAFGVWLTSLALMLFFPLIAVVPYVFVYYRGQDFARSAEALAKDPTALLIGIAATLPIHLVTLAIVWAVATGFRRRPFWQAVGWGWSRNFGFWVCVLTALMLYVAASALAYLLGVNKTPFDEMLESSAGALFATAFLATATAPLVEELVYRGVLYPALRKVGGAALAVIVVTFLFSFVHYWQYKNSPGTIAAITLLSLSLTIVRAWTGRVLPCFVIHLVFNGVQVIMLLFEHFIGAGEPQPQKAAPALYELLTHAPPLFLFL